MSEIRYLDYEIPMTFEEETKYFQIKDDVQADKLLEEIRDLEVEHNRIEIIAKAKIDSINQELLRNKEKMQKEVNFRENQLRAYFKNVKPKETKTMKKYKLFTGELVIKKATTQIIKDDEQLIKWARNNAKKFVASKPVLKWADMKKELLELNDVVIDTFTGKVLEDVVLVDTNTGIFADKNTGEIVTIPGIEFFKRALVLNGKLVEGAIVSDKAEEFQVKIN
ncbi:host-nuclease inhibitor Gam family protein [Clostridium algidicarnis]|uniref:host-nuclease inhibitor Gam family protein n=1 Tax=Clostridium algidicarnis TaxID=37659 RepID=UPI001C0BC282|nr:host-nuclease inhibitor Gam family protein [Clostridium algidicarnis]MBU3193493.1 host-nuclease inhibitor Gam family protein [Clostridium algidicarnis]MBU3203101.1 host-nuclease inhibitor Gam family protein [Clostridium algidicarnis]MBU3205601.1 host-nuclease inhibitor Gam family protein [Clostridium algidicarnis]MBU3211255.1 host-nuclease inhibitor Gam family protein [Clostridium algidicarnis]MBU3222237.1 host-nuclease inhibitor Gam family protein [Clostridium algidicarnis]